ncbi:MAG TPA: hypothetical protein VMM27_03205 [Casimicrobiaceae bacterium]|nr:hypothetical protein [Casimicrobiaceae bacterium]
MSNANLDDEIDWALNQLVLPVSASEPAEVLRQVLQDCLNEDSVRQAHECLLPAKVLT